MTQGDGRDTPDEFAHLFRPDSEPATPPAPHAAPEPQPDAAVPSDPFSAWEPLVAVPQAPPESTPQGGVRFEDPPLPGEAPNDQVESEAIDAQSIVIEDSGIEELGIEVSLSEEVVVEVETPVAAVPMSDPKDGRLFRSRGAPERSDAITAVGSMQARRLRTMSRGDEPSTPPQTFQEDVAVIVEEKIAEPAPFLPAASSGEPAPALQVMSGAALAGAQAMAEPSVRPSREERREQRAQRERSSSGSLTGLGVYAVTIGVTVILAFGETLVFGGEPGVITGIGLLAVSIFAAFAVRTYDGIHAIFAPSIAFFIATLTAGQVGINATGLTSRAVVVFFLLGGNWFWIVGSTAAALVIVALRRRVG